MRSALHLAIGGTTLHGFSKCCLEDSRLFVIRGARTDKQTTMAMLHGIRWIQRLDNYDKAVARLRDAARIISAEKGFSGEEDDLLKEGLVQRFEYTQELAWKVMKDYEEYQGYTDIQGRETPFARLSKWDSWTNRHGWTPSPHATSPLTAMMKRSSMWCFVKSSTIISRYSSGSVKR